MDSRTALGSQWQEFTAEKRSEDVPFFDFVPIDHYMVSNLHLEIGAINNVCNHMVSKAQAACEGYTAR